MKTVIIAGHECIFDADADTSNLLVSVNARGYKSISYRQGELAQKLYARVLLNAPSHLMVDHKNGNRLDNRKTNLRLATSQQNQFNSSRAKTKVSGLPKGVTKHGRSFRARLRLDGRMINLGTYDTVEKAEAEYKKAAEKHFGEFAFHLGGGSHEK